MDATQTPTATDIAWMSTAELLSLHAQLVRDGAAASVVAEVAAELDRRWDGA